MLGALTAAVYVGCPFRLSIVRGDSMSPTLRDGELCLLDRTCFEARAPQRGDVVVFRHGRDLFTKRIFGAPGDTLTLFRDVRDGTYIVPEPGQVWRMRRTQRWVQQRGMKLVYRVVTLNIPAGRCFVLGDNRSDSVDSRDFGLVDLDDVIGRMVTLPELHGP